MGLLVKVRYTLELIRFSHSVFALPFALVSLLVASHGYPSWKTLGLVALVMVAGRTASMAFNRLTDERLDSMNPRTRNRHLPKGLLSRNYIKGLTFFCSVLFFVACYSINELAFWLSPLALALFLGYSYTKRFTYLTHFWLGLCLGITPVGAWIAATGEISIYSVLLGGAVTFWVAGFDIIYGTQDIDFDRTHGVHSIPARFGVRGGLTVARGCHMLSLILLALCGFSLGLRLIYFGLVALIALAFFLEHRLVKPHDLSKVNAAFFTVNGFVSIGFLLGVAGILYL